MANLSYNLGEHGPGYLCIHPKQLAAKSRFVPDTKKNIETSAKKKEKK